MSLKKIVTVLCFFVLVGCVMNKTQADKALEDPITLNLVKQSIGDSMYLPQPPGPPEYVDNYYNSCSLFSRLKTSCALFFHPSASGTYREISCDALDLRLNNKGWYNISASSLVNYYMDKLANQSAAQQAEEKKRQADALKQKINDMATGKN